MCLLGTHCHIDLAESPHTSLISHRLTGWNAVKSRVEQLKLTLTDEQVWDRTRHLTNILILTYTTPGQGCYQ